MAWVDFWGAYNNTGPYNNVVLGGSPNSTGPYGAPLDTAHAAGFGRGIHFSDDGNYGVTFQLDLVPYAVTDAGAYRPNQAYVPFGGNYRYRLVVSTSNNDQASWNEIYNQFIFSHPDTWSMIYKVGWDATARASQWTQFFQLPKDTTHVKIELMGEEATFPHQNIYSIQQIIPDFRPWAVRKNGRFLSCDRATGFFKKRSGGQWKDVPKYAVDQAGKDNAGTSRIRKGRKWKGQVKVGD